MTRMKRRKVSTTLGLAVLALLREKPMHPYEMASTLRFRKKEDSIKLNYGSLYTVIEALARESLIRVRETVRDGSRPERTIYELTDSGREELHDWMSELLAVPVKEYPQFEAALSLLPVLPPDEATGLLEERLDRLDREIAGLSAGIEEAAEKDLEQLFLVENMYRLSIRGAERDWVAALVDRIRTSPDFTHLWSDFYNPGPGQIRD